MMYVDQSFLAVPKLFSGVRRYQERKMCQERKYILRSAPFHIQRAFFIVLGQVLCGSDWITVVVRAGTVTERNDQSDQSVIP